LTEAFMQAVEKDEEYDLVAPHPREVKKRLPRPARSSTCRCKRPGNPATPASSSWTVINRDNPTRPGRYESHQSPAASSRFCPTMPATWGPSTLALRYAPGRTSTWTGRNCAARRTWPCAFLDNVIERQAAYPLELITETVTQEPKIGLVRHGFRGPSLPPGRAVRLPRCPDPGRAAD
jgi:ribonucleoside-diphosphate reductase alpha chain